MTNPPGFVLPWRCHYGKQVYALSIFLMYGTGYPIGHTAVLTWCGAHTGHRVHTGHRERERDINSPLREDSG